MTNWFSLFEGSINRIAIIGNMGSGKSTFARNYSNQFGHQIFSISHEVKLLAKLILNRDIDKSLDRKLLQQIGEFIKLKEVNSPKAFFNKLNRNINIASDDCIQLVDNIITNRENQFISGYPRDTIWINRLLQTNFHKKMIIDDVRFTCEADLLHYNNFFLVKLQVPLKERIERLTIRDKNVDTLDLIHPSELDIDNINCNLTINIDEIPKS